VGGVVSRVEIIAVKKAPRTSYEVEHVFHTGGSNIPHFMPFGTTMGDILFTGPTYGMDGPTFKVGETPYEQAELCATLNQELYRRTGHTVDNLAQMFVWYHDEASHEAAIKYTDVLFPNAKDRPAIHYIQSPLPGGDLGNGVKGQFFIQYDIIGVRNGKRRVIDVPGIRVLDGAGVPAGVAMGNLCFTSVVLGHDPRTGVLPDSLEEQTAAAFDNARAVVEAGGFDSADIGHAYVWYGSLAARDTVDNVWSRQFPDVDQRPARHCLVGNLPPKVLVGIELTAAK
jgi:2-iminobutanoate/2-iminopropanoate deaminase